MDLKKLIIHEIIKTENETSKVEVDFSDDVAAKDAQAIKFITELNNRYRNLRQSNGKFRPSTIGLFPNHFMDYAGKNGDRDFVDFSKKTVCHLREIISKSGPAKGGYIVFAEYADVQPFISIFLIRNKAGNNLQKKKSDTKYIINETLHIDFEHLAMACRIDREMYTANNGSYLTFINRRNIDSNFFTNWICADELINNTRDTRNLLKILKEAEPPADENNKAVKQVDFINDVYKFIKDAPKGEIIDLKQIGSRFYEDENKLTSLAQDRNITLNHQFKPDNAVLRQFVSIKARAEGIDIVFPQQFLDEKKIELFPGEGKIVVKSSALIEKIEAEMIISNG